MGEIRQVWRGYDPIQVHVGLSVLDEENKRLRQRLAEAKEELELLRSAHPDSGVETAIDVDAPAEDKGEITRAIVLADWAAESVREDARIDAEVMRRQAEAELESVRSDIEAAKRELGALHSARLSLRQGDASDVATKIARIIDGDDGVGADSAAAQRMLEFAELLHRGPRGEAAIDTAVPRKVEVPARMRAKTKPAHHTAKPIPSRRLGLTEPVPTARPIELRPAPPAQERARETDDSGVPAPAQGRALASTAEAMVKPPLATRRKRVVRKSIDETADADV